MPDLDDLILEQEADRELIRRVTGRDPIEIGNAIVEGDRKDPGRIRSTQRLTIRRHVGGLVMLTWPAELKPQAVYLYSQGRAQRLLRAARADGWDVVARPHLAYRTAAPSQRFYLTPTITIGEYVDSWSRDGLANVGQHSIEATRDELWPWLLANGHASPSDAEGLEPFLSRSARRGFPPLMRPGLRLLRSWTDDEVTEMRRRGSTADDLRTAVNRLFEAMGDGRLPVRGAP